MAVSVINGYLCFSSCDVAKAETGVNPHPKLDHINGAGEPASGDRRSRADGPAVVFGGSLSQAAGSSGSAGDAGQAIAAAVTSQHNAIDFQA
jgi:hypothetical protein